MSLPQGRDWLPPSCCRKTPCDFMWVKYLYVTQKFWKKGRANLISCGTAKSQVSPPLSMPETLCHNLDLSKWKVFVQRINIFMACTTTKCNCPSLPLSSSILQPCNSDLLGYLQIALFLIKRETYAFQHSFCFGDFTVQITHQQLGFFLCKMWWEVINFYARVFLYFHHNFTWVLKTFCFAEALRELKHNI